MKKIPRSSISPVSVKNSQDETLEEIRRKISSSAALNGGFDTLLYKVDKIEQSQGQLVSKVDKIHDAIYDPNDGIFSKLSEFKLENSEKFGSIDEHVAELNEWKRHKEKELNKNDQEVDTATTKIAALEDHVDSLVKSKNTSWAVLKWLGVAVGGGIIALIFKWLETKIH